MYRLSKTPSPFLTHNHALLPLSVIAALLFLCTPLILLNIDVSQLNLSAILLTGGLFLGIIIFTIANGRLRNRKQQSANLIDSAFFQFGMIGQPDHHPTSRRFSGLWQGREVNIVLQPAQLFEWQLSTKLHSYWQVSNRPLTERSAVLLDPILFNGARLYAYGTQLLKLANQPAIVPLLQRLLLNDGSTQTRSLELHNGRLTYRQSNDNTVSDFTPSAATIEQLMNDLITLLNSAESQPK